MAARPAGHARNLKSQLLPMIFPGGINGLPNDGCGSNFALPDIARHAVLAKRGSLLSDRDLICHYGSVAMMVVTAAN
jgi:hypothetical protein